jgi:hypothetical protein
MNTPQDLQTQTLAAIMQQFKLLAVAFFQLNARFDALKAIVCELHPEVAARLEEKIRQDQNAASKEFLDLQRMLELLGANVLDQTH